MKNKILLTLASALIAGSMFAQNFEYEGVKYTVLSSSEMTVTTAEGTGSRDQINMIGGDVVLPEKVYNGSTEYTLTQIGRFSFANNENLTSVVIPSSVTTIQQSAFYYCRNLVEVDMPSTISFVGRNAFSNSNVRELIIPESLVNIGDEAFYNMSNLKYIYIPDHVKTIGNSAFSSCSGAKTIYIGDGVTSLGQYAFGSCRMEKLYIGKSVSYMDYMTFNNCSFLNYIVIAAPNPPTCVPFSAGSYYNFPMEGATYSNAGGILYVPAGSESKYKSTYGFRGFANIQAYVPKEEPANPGPAGDMTNPATYIYMSIGETLDVSTYFNGRDYILCESSNSGVADVAGLGNVTATKYGEAIIGAYNFKGELVSTVSVLVCPELTVVYPDGSQTKSPILYKSKIDLNINPLANATITTISQDGQDATEFYNAETGRFVSKNPVKGNTVLTLVAEEKEATEDPDDPTEPEQPTDGNVFRYVSDLAELGDQAEIVFVSNDVSSAMGTVIFSDFSGRNIGVRETTNITDNDNGTITVSDDVAIVKMTRMDSNSSTYTFEVINGDNPGYIVGSSATTPLISFSASESDATMFSTQTRQLEDGSNAYYFSYGRSTNFVYMRNNKAFQLSASPVSSSNNDRTMKIYVRAASTVEPEPEEPDVVTVPTSIFMNIGEAHDLSVYLSDNAEIQTLAVDNATWSSSDDAVTSVTTDGKATGVAYGAATITAKNATGQTLLSVNTYVGPTLTVVYPDGSQVAHHVPYNTPVKIDIAPSNRWDITSVSHDGSDITQAVNAGTYVSAPLTGNSTITLVAEEKTPPTTGTDNVETDQPIRILVNGRTLTVVGAADTDYVDVFNTQGQHIYHDTQKTFTVPSSGIYIVNVNGKSYKLAVL